MSKLIFEINLWNKLANQQVSNQIFTKLFISHQVYLITVTWSDNAVNIIYRRYSKFFDFQVSYNST